MIRQIQTTCTRCSGPMKLPEHVAALPADAKLCERCVKAAVEQMFESAVMFDHHAPEAQDFQETADCHVCGADLSLGYPEGDGCPHCLPCGGRYAPGTEECDWCSWASECS